MRLTTLLLLTTTGLAGFLGQATPQGQTGRQGTPDAATETNGILATWLLVGNEAEIQVAELARDKAQDPQVKQFAQMMISDHQQMVQKLQPVAQKVGYQGGEMAGAGGTRPREASAGGEFGRLDHVQLLQELGEKHVKSAKELLGSKQGSEFDKAFMGMMISEHAGMLDKLEVFQRHATGELEDTIRNGKGTVEKHFQQAKQLMDTLASGKSGEKR